MKKKYRVYFMANKNMDTLFVYAESASMAMKDAVSQLKQSGISFIVYNAVLDE